MIHHLRDMGGYGETATDNMGSGVWGSLYSPNVISFVMFATVGSLDGCSSLSIGLFKNLRCSCAESSKSL